MSSPLPARMLAAVGLLLALATGTASVGADSKPPVSSASGSKTETAKPSTAATKASAPPKSAGGRAAEIRGRVTGPDGKPLSGATVRVAASAAKSGGGDLTTASGKNAPASAKTGEDGGFKFIGLTGTSFAVRVEAAGLAPSVSWQIPPGASLRIQLKPGFAVAGRVFDAAKREPIPGATVVVWDRDAAPFGEDAARKLVSSDDGRFRAADMPQGLAYVEAWAAGKARERRSDIPVSQPKAEAGTSPAEEVELYLRPGGRVAGRVVGGDGKPVEGALVRIRPTSFDFFSNDRRASPRATVTDAEGRFALEGIPAGARIVIAAAKEGSAQAETSPIAIDAGTDRRDVEIRIEPGATLKFRLVDADDRPVTEADLRIIPSGERRGRRGGLFGGDVSEDKIRKEDDGTFTVRALESGTVKVTIVPERFADVDRDNVRLKTGEIVDLGTIRVKEGRFISGTVTDKSGQAVVGAEISAFWMEQGGGGRGRSAKSGDDGRYRLSGLGEAPVRQMWVRAKGYGSDQRQGANPGDTVDFVLERTGAIVGKVLLADGTAPPAFQIKAHPEAKQETGGFGGMFRVAFGDRDEETFTDPGGNFKLEGIEPGVVTVEATSQGKAPARKTGEKVVSDQITDVGTLVLRDGRTVRGRVVQSQDAAPIAGASIVASVPQGLGLRFGGSEGGAVALSNGDGSFEIAGLESRGYTLSVSHPDYAPGEVKIEVPENEDPAEIVVKLSRGGTLAGTVRDGSRQPVPDASILVMQGLLGGSPRSATTGPDGRYALDKLAPGQYSAMRVPDGDRILVGMGMKQATVRDGETTVLDFDETSKITVTGRVLRGGKPVPGARVVFAVGDSMVPGEFKMAESDAEGRYQIGLDKPGAYRALVQGGGMFGGSAGSGIPVNVPDQPAFAQDLVLSSAALSGRVTDPEGKPVSGALVRISRDGASEDLRGAGTSMTEPDGSYRIEGLEAGVYRVTASAAGYRNAEAYPVSIASDTPPPAVDLRLEAGRSIRGHVVDPQGRPVPQAMVFAAPAGSATSFAMPTATDVNGAFVLTAPSDGPVDLAASASGYGLGRASGVNPSGGDDEGTGVTVRLTVGGMLRVVVTGADGKPVAGAQIGARASTSSLGSDFAMVLGRPVATGPDGSATLGPLTAGSYEVSAVDRARRGTQTVVIPDGGEALATIVLP